MATTEVQSNFSFPESKASAEKETIISINRLLQLRTIGTLRQIELVDLSIKICTFDINDFSEKAYAMVFIVEQGYATQSEVAQAFDCCTRTLRRYQRAYERWGVAGLSQRKGPKKKIPAQTRKRNKKILTLVNDGLSNRLVSQRVGCSEATVRNVLKQLGYRRPAKEVQLSLELPQDVAPTQEGNTDENQPVHTPEPGMSCEHGKQSELQDAPSPQSEHNSLENNDNAAMTIANPFMSDVDQEDISTASPSITFDSVTIDRTVDRLFATMGLLTDAAPLFASKTEIPRLGVLLAIPALTQNGVLAAAEATYGCLGAAFYGLRTMVVVFILMALLRIKHPEGLKETLPQDWGPILGLDRAPETKTIRRKLMEFIKRGQAKAFGRALAEQRAKYRGEALGFLYVDGHVRVYHGQKTLPKTHIARLKTARPATSDYWVNDADGEPLFVVPTEANTHMVQILPDILKETRSLIGERRATVIFDRGGWSPSLFKAMIQDGFDLMTYRKGRWRPVGKKHFRQQEATINDQNVHFTLADTGVRLLRGRLRLRQVSILNEDGSQTAILTSRRDLSAIEVAYRMTHRWIQENFFKYMREEFALDALVDYEAEPADPERTVPNPQRRQLNDQIRAAKEKLCAFLGEHGQEALQNHGKIHTLKGFKIANAKTRKKIKVQLQCIAKLEIRRAKIPSRVAVKEVVKGDRAIKLSVERKHLTDLFKMVAYQIESDLVQHLTGHYARCEDEGRTLIQNALFSSGDLEVHDHDHELHVKLAPQSSPHRTKAIAALCETLNNGAYCFPGTNMRLRYSVKQEPGVSMAFPGPKAIA